MCKATEAFPLIVGQSSLYGTGHKNKRFLGFMALVNKTSALIVIGEGVKTQAKHTGGWCFQLCLYFLLTLRAFK